MNLWTNHICIEKDYEPWMGEAQFHEEKMSKIIIKDEITKQAKNQTLNLNLHKILTKRNNNLKTTLK